MPTFDPEIRKLAERILIKPRPIDSRVGVFASEVIPGVPGVKPVTIKMIDAKTKEHVETLEVDACLVATGRSPNTNGLGLDKVEGDERGGGMRNSGRLWTCMGVGAGGERNLFPI